MTGLRRIASLALLPVAALAAGACGHPPRPTAFPGAPVILISIDTLRADHLPAYGYHDVETPTIDALRRDGILYTRAYSHYPLTLPSHTTLLSGQLPPHNGVRDNIGYTFDAKSHPALAAVFAQHGYATGGFVSSYVLRAATGLSAGFSTYDSDIEIERGASLDAAQRPGSITVAHALDWLDAHSSQPFFLFLHLYEPHAPYDPPEPFKTRYAARPYDGEIATADDLVGKLIAALRSKGLYDRAVIALVSDHGEGLGEHDELFHGIFLYRSTLHVPLLLKLPGEQRAGESVERPVGLVDVLPTLVGLAGLPLPGDLDGTSLLDPRPPEDRHLYSETYYTRLHYGWSELLGLTGARWSFIQAPTPELYDLAADPGQTHNVLENERRIYSQRRDELASLIKPLQPPAAVDAEAAAKLAALGYVSGGGTRLTGELPDPKTQRTAVHQIELAVNAFSEGKFDDAVPLFRQLVDANPKMTDMWAFLARSLHRAGREEESLAAWQKTLELSAGDPWTALAVANSFVTLHRYKEAREHANLALTALPGPTNELLIGIDLAEGNQADAVARMERAVADGSASESLRRQLALRRLQQGEPEKAIELLQPLAAKGEAPTLTLLGLALADLDRAAEALPLVERAVQSQPDLPKAHEALGTVLLHLGRDADARAELERAVALDPKLAEAWNTLGVARYRVGLAPGAIEAWQRAAALDPTEYDALFNLGLAAAEAGRRDLARDALQRFVRTAPREHFAPDLEKARRLLTQLGGGAAAGSEP